MLTQCLAWDFGPHNVRVNAIAPGFVWTDMARPILSDPEIRTMLESRRPLGRIGEPDEIGTAALFLASEASSFVTGQTINVCGGVHN